MVPKRKLSKTVTEDLPSKTMTNCQNGLLKIRRNTISKNHPSLKNNSYKKKKDSWPSMPGSPKKLWRPKSERKLECKRN